jgi:hypothetical protein
VNEPNITVDPDVGTALAHVPGRTNPIGTWVSQGGQLWMFGGGAATAMQINWEKSDRIRRVRESDGELVPGGSCTTCSAGAARSRRRESPGAEAAASHQPRYRHARLLGLPDYLFEKSPATDDFATYAPNRSNQSDFYQGAHPAEGLTKPNEVTEDVDPAPDIVRLESVVDTVYESVGGQLGSTRPVMTVWHGGTNGQRQIFSGFQLWYWRRSSRSRSWTGSCSRPGAFLARTCLADQLSVRSKPPSPSRPV